MAKNDTLAGLFVIVFASILGLRILNGGSPATPPGNPNPTRPPTPGTPGSPTKPGGPVLEPPMKPLPPGLQPAPGKERIMEVDGVMIYDDPFTMDQYKPPQDQVLAVYSQPINVGQSPPSPDPVKPGSPLDPGSPDLDPGVDPGGEIPGGFPGEFGPGEKGQMMQDQQKGMEGDMSPGQQAIAGADPGSIGGVKGA